MSAVKSAIRLSMPRRFMIKKPYEGRVDLQRFERMASTG